MQLFLFLFYVQISVKITAFFLFIRILLIWLYKNAQQLKTKKHIQIEFNYFVIFYSSPVSTFL